MLTLPPAFAALRAYKQFILYRLEPLPDGKTSKRPVDWRTQKTANAHDPAIWLPFELASLNAQVLGLGVGFVLTEADPFWFVDIDDCLTGDAWSPLAHEIMSSLAGCAIEVSQSGAGLHLIGTGKPPAHRVAPNDSLGLYTHSRFVALTGTHAVGDAGLDLTARLPAVVDQWFPSGTIPGAPPVEWTDSPCETWRGPEDDDVLIGKMLAATSAAATFGNRASFRQLWEADADALVQAYPRASGDGFDASSADAALAQHLAFWTGRDCGRIRRLMERSALSREKWERADYLSRTILGSCARCDTVYGQGSAATAALPPPAQGERPIGSLLSASELPSHFEGVVYIEDRYAAAAPDGTLLDPQQFRANSRYGGHKFMLDHEKTTRNAWEAFTENGTFRAPWAHSMCFRPELPPRSLIEDSGRKLFNSYVPADVRRVKGDAGPFLRHLEKLFPLKSDRDQLLAYMASLAQNPGVKFQWCPLIQGVEGNGKTLLIKALSYAVGEQYTHRPNALDLANKFNAWLERKLFIGVEEIHVADKRDALDTLKVLITNNRIEFQAKGADQITGDNRANFLLCTNHKDAVPKTLNDRRYMILYTAQQEAADIARDGMAGRYFPDLYGWMNADGCAIVADYLLSYSIPAALDPAVDCHRAPTSSSTEEAIQASLGPVEQAIMEAVGNDDVGFRGGWISSTQFANLLDARRLRGRCPPLVWDATMQSLGYVKHPALAGGRVNNPVEPDGKKSRLWIKRDSIPHLNLVTAAQVANAYSLANGHANGVFSKGAG